MIKQNKQQSGENSVNTQVHAPVNGNVTITHGIDYQTAKKIAKDTFDANIEKLVGVAKESAEQRVNIFIERFLSELPPESYGHLVEPRVILSVLEAQKGFIRSGDEIYLDRLNGILINILSKPELEMKELMILEDTISTASKLSRPQLDILSCLLQFQSTNQSIKTKADVKLIVQDFEDFFRDSFNNFDFMDNVHLASKGCVVIGARGHEFAYSVECHYPYDESLGQWFKGRTLQRVWDEYLSVVWITPIGRLIGKVNLQETSKRHGSRFD